MKIEVWTVIRTYHLGILPNRFKFYKCLHHFKLRVCTLLIWWTRCNKLPSHMLNYMKFMKLTTWYVVTETMWYLYINTFSCNIRNHTCANARERNSVKHRVGLSWGWRHRCWAGTSSPELIVFKFRAIKRRLDYIYVKLIRSHWNGKVSAPAAYSIGKKVNSLTRGWQTLMEF